MYYSCGELRAVCGVLNLDLDRVLHNNTKFSSQYTICLYLLESPAGRAPRRITRTGSEPATSLLRRPGVAHRLLALQQRSAVATAAVKVKFTGLTKICKLTQQFEWKIPVKSLELTQILGQPCEL
jgi:hypothetical protein